MHSIIKSITADLPPGVLVCASGRQEECAFYLEDSLQKFGVTVDFVKQDEDWAAYLDDSGFTGLLKRFEKED